MSSCNCLSEKKKMWISLQTALIALIVFSPMFFKLVSGVVGRSIASSDGLATPTGLIVHGLVLALILWLLMKPKALFKKSAGYKAANDVQGMAP
jgi:ABC-type long-subunit fatty acid transport system fused permease/ATPase subunit